jgi:hypothetical protein
VTVFTTKSEFIICHSQWVYKMNMGDHFCPTICMLHS